MPINPGNQSNKVLETQGFAGRRLRDKGMRTYEPQADPKSNRESSASPKSDKIFDSKEFKKAVRKQETDFSSRSFSVLKRMDGSSVPKR